MIQILIINFHVTNNNNELMIKFINVGHKTVQKSHICYPIEKSY